MNAGCVAARAAAFLTLAILLAIPSLARSHCDSLDGPVIRDARIALAAGDVTPVLKWVRKEHEDEIRDVFARTTAVRALGDEAFALADRLFFETLVRLHRAGEGEAFTGLKPASDVDPGIAAADQSLASSSPDELVEHLVAAVREETRRRFEVARDLGRHAHESVEAGRAYVAAYVDYIHFVESVNRLASHGAPAKHHEP
jgi:hypothetical protein